MCGIVGVHYFDLKRSVEAEHLMAMNDALTHRGPDDAGHHIFGHVGIAMRRLSIIDLATGHQPMFSDDKSIAVVFNGEIYNFKEIRSDLIKKGYSFRTHSDTEVFIHAYQEYGDSFIERFNGMFGFAIWDDRQKRLLLGRDRIGVKPLYFYKDSHIFAFASEIKALMQYPEISREVNPTGLSQFLTFEYTMAPQTMLKNVYKLKPGHLLVVKDNQVAEKIFWKPRVQKKDWTEDDAIRALRSELSKAIQRRLISDVPLGAFLSGGVDSSIIVGLMSQMQSKPVKTFSIAFEDKSYDESSYARLVANKFKTDHHEFKLEVNPANFLDDFVRYLDEPVGDVSLFPTFLVSRAARSHVTVSLSGDGGDELFGGYDTYLANRMARTYQRVVPAWGQRAMAAVAQQLTPREAKKGFVNRVKRFTEGLNQPAGIQQYRWMTFLNQIERNQLFSRDFQAQFKNDEVYSPLIEKFVLADPSWEPLAQQSWVDIQVYLPEDILAKVDITSMDNSLEVRVPFLDFNMVELALSFPDKFRINGSERKYILKKAFEDILPKDILTRKKEGFSIPLKNWIKNELKSAMMDILDPREIREQGFFNWNYIQKLIEQHHQGIQNHAHKLWCLMVFQMWHRKFINGKN